MNINFSNYLNLIVLHLLTMFLAVSPSQFNIYHIMISEKTKNNVMEGGDFYRLYYSDNDSNSNGVFICFTFKDVYIEKYFNKVKCSFDENSNNEIIRQLKQIEKNIINCSRSQGKTTFRIEEQLNHNFIKIFTENNINFGKNKNINIVLKISGIWNNYDSCGLTFRFYIVNHLLNT